jgi:DNA-binding transcriptional LysR family regulator
VKSITSIIKLVKEGVGIAIVPSHTIINEKIKTYDIKGLKRPQIHLSSLNFQSLPKYLRDFTEIVKSNA